MKRSRGGLVFKAHRLLYHSTLGLRVIKKKKRVLRARYFQEQVFLQVVMVYFLFIDRLRTGVPREQKMLKGHLPGVIYHQVY